MIIYRLHRIKWHDSICRPLSIGLIKYADVIKVQRMGKISSDFKFIKEVVTIEKARHMDFMFREAMDIK